VGEGVHRGDQAVYKIQSMRTELKSNKPREPFSLWLHKCSLHIPAGAADLHLHPGTCTVLPAHHIPAN
jgi:hypothetical protein